MAGRPRHTQTRSTNRSRTSNDQGVKMAVEVLAMVWVLSIGLYYVSSYPPPAPRGDQVAYDQLEQNLEDVLSTGQYVCCAQDPTAPNVMIDLAMSTWAGNETAHQQFHRAFDQMFPPGTVYNLGIVYTGANDNRPTRIPAVFEWQPTGQTVGAIEIVKPHDRHDPIGPAYVVPRLENVTGSAALDVQVIPLHPLMPYRLSPSAQVTRPALEASVTYQTQGVGLDEERSDTVDEEHVQQTVYPEISGAWAPAATLVFEEPDWEEMVEEGLPISSQGSDDLKSVLVLTSEDLAAERLLQNETCRHNPLTPGCNALETEPYPQHGFRLNTTLHGPGLVTDPTHNTTLDHLYKLTITIPREWTDIEINRTDSETNRLVGWTSTHVNTYTPGQTTITSFLTLDPNETTTRTLNTPDGPPRPHDVVPAEQVTSHPFHFHARPPPQANSTDLGFGTIHARLENVQLDHTYQGLLSVELGSATGRVHRTVQALTPGVVPPTTVGGSPPSPQGVDLLVGAILQNGGDDVLLTNLSIRVPAGLYAARTLEPVWQSTTTEGTWFTTDTRITWTPEATDTLCEAMTACGALARISLTGESLPQTSHEPLVQASQFYTHRNLGHYLSNFVLEAPRDGTVQAKGLAHQVDTARPGANRGAYVVNLDPSTTPICTQDQLDDRAGNASFDGQEDGYAWIKSQTLCLLDNPDLTADDHPGNVTFPLLVQTGTTENDGTVTTVGRTTLRAIQGVPAETFTNWQTTASQARITGDETVSPGTTARFDVEMEGLARALDETADGGFTVKYRVLDPYNAWEDTPWSDGKLLAYSNLDDQRGVEECYPNAVAGCSGLTDLPTSFTVTLPIPRHTPPGTHLLQLEVSWLWASDVDETVGQTANLLYPFDVVSSTGAPQALTGLEGLAWLEDWR